MSLFYISGATAADFNEPRKTLFKVEGFNIIFSAFVMAKFDCFRHDSLYCQNHVNCEGWLGKSVNNKLKI